MFVPFCMGCKRYKFFEIFVVLQQFTAFHVEQPRADDHAAIGAAGALLRYIAELQPAGTPHLCRPTVRRSARHLWIDEMTRRNLELVEPLRAGARGTTLLEVLDRSEEHTSELQSQR